MDELYTICPIWIVKMVIVWRVAFTIHLDSKASTSFLKYDKSNIAQ
jgi:hypothetical protein